MRLRLLLLVVLCVPRHAYADEVENVLYSQCSQLEHSFVLHHFHVVNGEPPPQHAAAWPALLSKKVMRLKGTNYYLEHGEVVSSVNDQYVTYAPIRGVCSLGKDKIEFIVEYGSYSVSGMCGMSPGARLTIKLNEKEAFANTPFDADCSANVSVQKVIFSKTGIWKFCGGGEQFGGPEFCISPPPTNWIEILSVLGEARARTHTFHQ